MDLVSDVNGANIAEYRDYTRRKVLFVVTFAVILFLLFGYSLTFGRTDISLMDTYALLFDHILGATYTPDDPLWYDDYAIWNVRVPKSLFAIIGGASLAVAGAAMQSVMKNPLADAYTTGISSGASVGVALAMILGINLISAPTVSQMGIFVNAFIFSLLPMAIIIVVSKRMDTSPASLILAGTAISYFLNAITTILMLMAEDSSMEAVYKWTMGSLTTIGWTQTLVMSLVSVVGMIVMVRLASKLNILSLGDESAKALGLDVETLRLVCLILMSMMVASVISFAGILGFVGLVCPHIVRFVLDADNRFVIPAAALVASIFMLGAHVITEFLMDYSIQMPIGVVLSFVGAPIFLYLILRRNSNVW